MPENKEQKHSIYGPSKIGLAAICPASVRLAEGHDVQDVASARGTKLHGVMATGSDMLDDKEEKLSAWEQELIRRTREWEAQFEPAEVYREAGLGPLKLHGIDEPLWPIGTADAIRHGPEPALHDYKFGDLEPEAAHVVPQLRMYGAMALQQNPLWPRITLRAFHASSRTVIDLVLTREELPGVLKRFAQVIKAGESKAPVFSPGGHCRYCNARIRCPVVYQGVVLATPKAQILDLDALSPRDRATLLEKAKLAIDVGGRLVKELTTMEDLSPGSILGYEIRIRKTKFLVKKKGK